MATFAELKRQVSLRLKDENNTAVSSADVGLCINQSIKYWKRERYWFNEDEATFSTTIGDPVLNITGFLYLVEDYGLSIPYQNINYDLVKKPVSQFHDIISRGRPNYYAWSGGEYTLYWIPDAVYTVNAVGIKDYADLVNDTDTNDFTDNADQLIVFEAASRAWSIRQDMEKAREYATAAQDEDRVLKKRTNSTVATGSMTVYESIPTGEYYGDYI